MGPLNGRWLVSSFRRAQNGKRAAVECRRGTELLQPERTSEVATSAGASDAPGLGISLTGASTGTITAAGGAKGIVDAAVSLAVQVGGSSVYAGSTFRPGSTTTSGSVSDHAFDDASRSARDIGVRGINLLTGPPSPRLDRAVVAIGKAFGRDYGDGNRTIIDTFTWKGYRVQIIWRTPKYGGHMGHIHIGARRG